MKRNKRLCKFSAYLQALRVKTARLAAVLALCLVVPLQVNANELKAKGEYIIEPGESLYAVVANNYPERMNRWTDVASDIVSLNPELFPRGMDTPLRPGMVLKLVDYDSGTPASTPANSAARSTNAGTTETTAAELQTNSPQPTPDRASSQSQNPQNSADQVGARDSDEKSDSAAAADESAAIGRVITLNGNAQATNYADRARSLSEGGAIYRHEIIHTGRNTEITLQMIDEAQYTIHNNSRFTFETYDFADRADSDRSVVTLSGGGFRVVSGKIGKGKDNAMAVNTPAATITVRDSDFALRICEQDACRLSVAGYELKNGLYAGLLQGTAVLTNNAGPQRINAGEFFYTPSPDSIAMKAPESAALLFSIEELSKLERSDEDDPKSFLGWLMSKLFGD